MVPSVFRHIEIQNHTAVENIYISVSVRTAHGAACAYCRGTPLGRAVLPFVLISSRRRSGIRIQRRHPGFVQKHFGLAGIIQLFPAVQLRHGLVQLHFLENLLKVRRMSKLNGL